MYNFKIIFEELVLWTTVFYFRLDDGQVRPLNGFAFVLDPKLDRPKTEISKIILKLGGRVYSNITSRVNAMLSTKGNKSL